MNINPPAIKYSGDKSKSISLKSQGLQFYRFLSQQLNSQNISFINRSIILSDGSIISANLRKDRIYNNIFGDVFIKSYISSEVSKEHKLVFSFIDNTGYWVYLDEVSLTLKPFPTNYKIIGYYTKLITTDAAISIDFTGNKNSYGKNIAVSLAFAKYSLTDDTEYSTITGGSTTGLFKNRITTSSYKTGLSLIKLGKQYVINSIVGAQDVFNPGNIEFGQAIGVSSYSSSETIFISGSNNVFLNNSVFTGRYTDGSWYGDGVAPWIYQYGGIVNTIKLFKVNYISPAKGAEKGIAQIITPGSVNLPGVGSNTFITYTDITYSANRYYFTKDNKYSNDSKLIYASVYHMINSALYSRGLSIQSIKLQSSLLTTGSETNLTNFQLTEQDYTHFNGSPPTIYFYNRDKYSILSGIEYITYEDTLGIRKDYVCFIKKNSGYTSTYVNHAIDGSYVNNVSEAIYSIKIDLSDNSIVQTLVHATTFSEVSYVVGGVETTIARADSDHVIECYYADYINNIYVFGKIRLGADTLVSALGTVPYQLILSDNGTTSILDTKSADMSGYNYNRTFTAPVPSGYIYNPWSLWESFRYLAKNKTGVMETRKAYAIKRQDQLDQTTGVFTARPDRGDFSDTYYVTTISGITTLTKIFDSSTNNMEQHPFITNLY